MYGIAIFFLHLPQVECEAGARRGLVCMMDDFFPSRHISLGLAPQDFCICAVKDYLFICIEARNAVSTFNEGLENPARLIEMAMAHDQFSE